MRGNRKAILVDIHERKLNPKVAYSNMDKSGRMISTGQVESVVVPEEKSVIFASTQKVQPKKENVVEEKAVDEIVNDLKPADIVEEQDGFLIPSIAKKIATVETVEEEVFATEVSISDVVAANKKAKKKKKALNQD